MITGVSRFQMSLPTTKICSYVAYVTCVYIGNSIDAVAKVLAQFLTQALCSLWFLQALENVVMPRAHVVLSAIRPTSESEFIVVTSQKVHLATSVVGTAGQNRRVPPSFCLVPQNPTPKVLCIVSVLPSISCLLTL